MKHISVLFAAATYIFVAACTKHDSEPVLIVDNTNLTLPSPAGKDTLSISSNRAWQLSNLPSWLTVSPAQGEGGL